MNETEQNSININADPKLTIEALIFVSNAPVTRTQIKEIIKDSKDEDIEKYVNDLNEEYEKSNRSFRVEEIAGGWQIRTKPEFSAPIKSLLNIQRRERLSGPALETLAIIAYKQPITKAEIEGIRGVNGDWMISNLIDKDLVRVAGRKDIIGHPFMYGTTTRFLEHFGLASLKDLPNVEELRQKNFSQKTTTNTVVENKEPEAVVTDLPSDKLSINEELTDEAVKDLENGNEPISEQEQMQEPEGDA
jgi:segregation and condensation protein B